MADNTTVLTSQRLWSEEVAIAAASDPEAQRPLDDEPGYEFSGNNNFKSGKGPYANPVIP